MLPMLRGAIRGSQANGDPQSPKTGSSLNARQKDRRHCLFKKKKLSLGQEMIFLAQRQSVRAGVFHEKFIHELHSADTPWKARQVWKNIVADYNGAKKRFEIAREFLESNSKESRRFFRLLHGKEHNSISDVTTYNRAWTQLELGVNNEYFTTGATAKRELFYKNLIWAVKVIIYESPGLLTLKEVISCYEDHTKIGTSALPFPLQRDALCVLTGYHTSMTKDLSHPTGVLNDLLAAIDESLQEKMKRLDTASHFYHQIKITKKEVVTIKENFITSLNRQPSPDERVRACYNAIPRIKAALEKCDFDSKFRDFFEMDQVDDKGDVKKMPIVDVHELRKGKQPSKQNSLESKTECVPCILHVKNVASDSVLEKVFGAMDGSKWCRPTNKVCDNYVRLVCVDGKITMKFNTRGLESCPDYMICPFDHFLLECIGKTVSDIIEGEINWQLDKMGVRCQLPNQTPNCFHAFAGPGKVAKYDLHQDHSMISTSCASDEQVAGFCYYGAAGESAIEDEICYLPTRGCMYVITLVASERTAQSTVGWQEGKSKNTSKLLASITTEGMQIHIQLIETQNGETFHFSKPLPGSSGLGIRGLFTFRKFLTPRNAAYKERILADGIAERKVLRHSDYKHDKIVSQLRNNSFDVQTTNKLRDSQLTKNRAHDSARKAPRKTATRQRKDKEVPPGRGNRPARKSTRTSHPIKKQVTKIEEPWVYSRDTFLQLPKNEYQELYETMKTIKINNCDIKMPMLIRPQIIACLSPSSQPCYRIVRSAKVISRLLDPINTSFLKPTLVNICSPKGGAVSTLGTIFHDGRMIIPTPGRKFKLNSCRLTTTFRKHQVACTEDIHRFNSICVSKDYKNNPSLFQKVEAHIDCWREDPCNRPLFDDGENYELELCLSGGCALVNGSHTVTAAKMSVDDANISFPQPQSSESALFRCFDEACSFSYPLHVLRNDASWFGTEKSPEAEHYLKSFGHWVVSELVKKQLNKDEIRERFSFDSTGVFDERIKKDNKFRQYITYLQRPVWIVRLRPFGNSIFYKKIMDRDCDASRFENVYVPSDDKRCYNVRFDADRHQGIQFADLDFHELQNKFVDSGFINETYSDFLEIYREATERQGCSFIPDREVNARKNKVLRSANDFVADGLTTETFKNDTTYKIKILPFVVAISHANIACALRAKGESLLKTPKGLCAVPLCFSERGRNLCTIFQKSVTPCSSRPLDATVFYFRKEMVAKYPNKLGLDKLFRMDFKNKSDVSMLIDCLFGALINRVTGRCNIFEEFKSYMKHYFSPVTCAFPSRNETTFKDKKRIPVLACLFDFFYEITSTNASQTNDHLTTILTSTQFKLPSVLRTVEKLDDFVRRMSYSLDEFAGSDRLLNESSVGDGRRRRDLILLFAKLMANACGYDVASTENNSPENSTFNFLAMTIFADIEELFFFPMGFVMMDSLFPAFGGKDGQYLIYRECLDEMPLSVEDLYDEMVIILEEHSMLRQALSLHLDQNNVSRHDNSRPFNLTDVEWSCCQIRIIAGNAHVSRNHSFRAQSYKPHCYPLKSRTEWDRNNEHLQHEWDQVTEAGDKIFNLIRTSDSIYQISPKFLLHEERTHHSKATKVQTVSCKRGRRNAARNAKKKQQKH